MAAHLYITNPLDEAEKRHGDAFATAVTTSMRGHGRASQARVDELYSKLYPPTMLFEDPYTHEGVLWTWGLDWGVDVKMLLQGEQQNELVKEGLAWLLDLLNLRHKLPTEKAMAAWSTPQMSPISTTKAHMKLWHKYYRERRKAFKKFIARALELESPVECNLNL